MYHPSCADRDQLPDYWSGGTSQAHPPTLDAGTLNTTAVVLLPTLLLYDPKFPLTRGRFIGPTGKASHR
ncbi:uncharacterized protein BO96DRAFT_332018 [Aspergillus niger CBS 101883]|uniref:Uncharacterized protein n=3 Tax=Aspergillus niger TaxID=5061 RepID=A2QQC9_ASPNC|nr:uncharacterized protein BO96DRAFT_332018 [Aspergillus niger CBS 101883]XP_059603895.1 hypothetical protein An08g02070 [Aspergillus niger]PYH59180.1 hypothetical protein BO96DRAFT_332018 [Aspergillus niger CBS 101883]RDH13993.1 hypothetical protein M747DRAFT_250488 [Aspergillus niger ATCC 13496]CAK45254.1 hypothetical protein An08g02070 [Aspergillus niger]